MRLSLLLAAATHLLAQAPHPAAPLDKVESLQVDEPVRTAMHRNDVHPGEISGFRSHNFVLPDLKAAIVLLTNAEYSDAVGDVRHNLVSLGDLKRVRLGSTQLRRGAKHYALTLVHPHRTLQVAEYDLENGNIEQFLIDASLSVWQG